MADDSIKYVYVDKVMVMGSVCNGNMWDTMINFHSNKNIRVYYDQIFNGQSYPKQCDTRPRPQLPDPKYVGTLLDCYGKSSYKIKSAEYISSSKENLPPVFNVIVTGNPQPTPTGEVRNIFVFNTSMSNFVRVTVEITEKGPDGTNISTWFAPILPYQGILLIGDKYVDPTTGKTYHFSAKVILEERNLPQIQNL